MVATSSRCTPGRDARAWSSVALLPASVTARRHPARDTAVAMRAAGKCGSRGRYAPPAFQIASTVAIQSRSRSITTATTSSRRSPWASRARASRLARRVELAVRPVPVPVHRRDGVRLYPHTLLEQLVHAAVGQHPVRPVETLELEPELVLGEQALPPVVRVRVGGDQRQRGEVVPGDPGGGLGVEHVGPVAEPEAELRRRAGHPDRQDDVVVEVALGAPGVEEGLERGSGQAEVAPQLGDGVIPVSVQRRLGAGGIDHDTPPGVRPGGHAARQRRSVRRRRRSRWSRRIRRTGRPGRRRARPAAPSSPARPVRRPTAARRSRRRPGSGPRGRRRRGRAGGPSGGWR